MATLGDQIRLTLPPGMYLPEPLELLFTWIENNGFAIDRDNRRIGFLSSMEKLKAEWTETQRPGGTHIEFFAEGNAKLKYWFGHERPEVLNRVCVFAQAGSDGSMAAFWIDDDGQQRIVHLGSGSGSTLVCVLADDPVDFLRLLAIGYDEICWSSAFSKPPNADRAAGELFVHPNVIQKAGQVRFLEARRSRMPQQTPSCGFQNSAILAGRTPSSLCLRHLILPISNLSRFYKDLRLGEKGQPQQKTRGGHGSQPPAIEELPKA